MLSFEPVHPTLAPTASYLVRKSTIAVVTDVAAALRNGTEEGVSYAPPIPHRHNLRHQGILGSLKKKTFFYIEKCSAFSLQIFAYTFFLPEKSFWALGSKCRKSEIPQAKVIILRALIATFLRKWTPGASLRVFILWGSIPEH